MTTLLLDTTSLEPVEGLPRDAARVVVRGQVSPWRREALSRRFPRAEVVSIWPGAAGAWQDRVERDLALVASRDARLDGVPLLECFRAAWREECSWLRAGEWALAGSRRVAVPAGSPSAAWAAALRDTRGLDLVDVVPGSGTGTKRPGLVSRVRRAGRRGVAQALASRYDPSHARRAAMRRAPTLPREGAVLVASYANPARAALEAHAALGGGDALLVRTGPGALEGVTTDAAVVALSLAAALALLPDHGDAARRRASAAAREALAAISTTEDPFGPGTVESATGFGRALLDVHLLEVASAVAAFGAIADRMKVRRVVVGDEFAFCDRAVLHAAKARGIETVSRQHGVIDSHYLRDVVLADRHLAWDAATAEWLRSRGAARSSRLEALARSTGGPPTRSERPRTVVVFLQPLEFVHVPTRDWMRETLLAVVPAAERAGLETVLKPHPLQTLASVRDTIPAEVRGRVRVTRGASARALLADAAVAVTLDSSVCVDCRDAGVRCLSTTWYPGTYDHALERLGWVEPCADPESVAAGIASAVATAGPR